MTADMFGKEAALFCPSGTMTNQIAIRMHTKDLDEMICDHLSHVYQYEGGGYASSAGIGVKLIKGSYGKVTAEQIKAAIQPDYDWLPNTALVVLENSCNKGGGSYYTLDEIAPIRSLCLTENLKLHLDGARLFNVLVETGESTEDVGNQFDSISICLSKGLGAPVGSLLIGSTADIKQARRFRKVMGGGMRQAGYLAAACIYALKNNVDRLRIDNQRAKAIGELLSKQSCVATVRPVKTNIVVFELGDVSPQEYVNYLQSKNISSSVFGPTAVRLVFHLDVTQEMVEEVVLAIKSY